MWVRGWEDFRVPSLQRQGAAHPVCVKTAACLKGVRPVPDLFASPSHLPLPPWLALGGTSPFDPFANPPVSTETKEGPECAQALPSGKPGSPVGKQEAGDDTALGNEGPAQRWPLSSSSQSDHSPSLPMSSIISVPELDLFGDPIPSSKQNGTKEPESFDLGVLEEALTQPSKEARACRTPESFLGPSASSLVNLDSLVKAPQAAKTRNPFLTGRTPLVPAASQHWGPLLSPSLLSAPALKMLLFFPISETPDRASSPPHPI